MTMLRAAVFCAVSVIVAALTFAGTTTLLGFAIPATASCVAAAIVTLYMLALKRNVSSNTPEQLQEQYRRTTSRLRAVVLTADNLSSKGVAHETVR